MSDEQPQEETQALVARLPNGQWPPGVSGNPSGMKPGRYSLLSILRRKLQEASEVYGEDGVPLSVAEVIVRATLIDAAMGDAQSRKLVWEYIEGKPRQTIAVGGDPDGPPIAFSVADTIRDYAATFAEALEALDADDDASGK